MRKTWDDQFPALNVSFVLKKASLKKNSLRNQEPRLVRNFLYYTVFEYRFFNEMWFLTVDPLVGIPVFIATLSKRQYCWRVFEDFHCQEYTTSLTYHSAENKIRTISVFLEFISRFEFDFCRCGIFF